ncbi:MAG: peptidase M56 BlaR1 [Clostridia bacterium]|nr:peptidase M56 BlaR1 [Clostridia bacterium]
MNVKVIYKKSVFLLILLVGILAGSAVYASINMIKQKDYPKNESGETYGSALYAENQEDEPDLIKAIGVDGTVGYVKSSDLTGDKPKSPKEALEKQNKMPSKKEINLYESDGRTIIGKFKIETGEAEIKDKDGKVVKTTK